MLTLGLRSFPRNTCTNLGVVCTRGFRVALKVTKAVTAEKSTQITRNRHQYSLIVKYRGTTHIWKRVTICGNRGKAF